MSNVVREMKFKNEILCPIAIKDSDLVSKVDNLKSKRMPNVSFHQENMVVFEKKGAFVLLDFGKEICGGIRFIVRETEGYAKFHIRLGESLTEATTPLGEKNTGNDHSPRDFEVEVSSLCDLTFGQSGFRFAYIELLSDEPVITQSIFAVNNLPDFPAEAKITTNDEKLNKIIDAAIYTMNLCCQNGYIWDGIKRDRLVWSGDMHQEILTALYSFGDNDNIRNSLDFIKYDTNSEEWVNWIPSYSAWWVISLCDYCDKSGNWEYFLNNKDFAITILEKINSCIDKDGNVDLSDVLMGYFLDWPTFESKDAEIGTIALFILACKKYLEVEDSEIAKEILNKLMPVIENSKPQSKQAITFKFLADGNDCGIAEAIEKNGCNGFSTFMTYYLLTADFLSGGDKMLQMIRDYFGAMLDKGATTFWEDFDMEWVPNSCRIDELPKADEKDIHGDFGKYCYLNFRHSLCHGWSSGVVAFIIENIIGLKIKNGKVDSITPNLFDLEYINAKIPLKDEVLEINIDSNGVKTSYKSINF